MVLNLDVDGVCLANWTLSVDLVRGSTSIHCVIHNAAFVDSLTVVHKWVLLAWCLPHWSVAFISLSVLGCYISVLLPGGLTHDTSSDDAQSTGVLALPPIAEIGSLLDCIELIPIVFDRATVLMCSCSDGHMHLVCLVLHLSAVLLDLGVVRHVRVLAQS